MSSLFVLLPIAMAGIAGWLIVSLGQWLLLRRQYRNSGCWVFFMLGGVILGPAAGWLAASFLYSFLLTDFFALLIPVLCIGATFGAITGAGLIWILRRPKPEPSPQSLPPQP